MSVLSRYQEFDPSPSLNRLTPIPSQILSVSVNNKSLDITLDSGATVSYIKSYKADLLGLKINPNDQLALLADEKTRMASMGEVDFLASFAGLQLRVRALVMKNLQADCFGGTTFHADNDISARIKTGEIRILNSHVVVQSNPVKPFPLFPPPVLSKLPTQISSSTCHSSQLQCSISDTCPFEAESDKNNIPQKNIFPAQTKFNTISLPFQTVTMPEDFLPIPLPTNLVFICFRRWTRPSDISIRNGLFLCQD